MSYMGWPPKYVYNLDGILGYKQSKYSKIHNIIPLNFKFVAYIILHQPKEWKIFSCLPKQKHLSFSKRRQQVS